MLCQQLQTPSFKSPHIESDYIGMMLDGIEFRDGNPLSDAENLLQVAEMLMDTGLSTVPKEAIWTQMEGFFIYLLENHPSDFSDDNEEGEQIIILSLNNRLYLEDYCASAMIRKQLYLLTENKLKRDKLKNLYRESYAASVVMNNSEGDFEPFRQELKDEARQWLQLVPERSAFTKEGWHQPSVRGPLRRYLAEIGAEQD
jgi:hypothetical protein